MRLSTAYTAALLSATVSFAAASNLPNDTISAGYHVIWSYPGTTIPQSLISATNAGKVGGVIIFGENVNSNLPSQIASLQNTYKSSASYPGFPLLIVTDQEGGYVNRLPGGPSQSAKQVGQSSDPAKAASNAASTIAGIFEQYGHNGDLAPVLDVYRQSGNFIDKYQRSYGNTSALVAKCIGPFISTLQGRKVAATAKHFPGLGAAPAGADTDAEPVTIDLSLDELRAVDEGPYATAIANGVDMIMASWAKYPALDANKPAGLSRRWIQDELRTRLGFKGVTITDALEAGALAPYGDTQVRSVMAVSAGMDILLAASRNTTQGADAVNAIVFGLGSGEIDRTEFQASMQRIVNLRKSLL